MLRSLLYTWALKPLDARIQRLEEQLTAVLAAIDTLNRDELDRAIRHADQTAQLQGFINRLTARQARAAQLNGTPEPAESALDARRRIRGF